MPQEIQLESMSYGIQEAGLVEASHLDSHIGFLELDGVHTGLVRGSQLQFIIKIFPSDDNLKAKDSWSNTDTVRPFLGHWGQT